MKILAMDIARNTGFAVGSPGGTPRAWSVDLGVTHDDRFARALKITSNLIQKHSPDVLAIEDVVGRAKTPHVNVGIISCVRGMAHARGVKIMMCPVQTVRKHFLGRAFTTKDFPGLTPNKAREAIKAQVMGRCALLGWKAEDDDQADSLALWDFAGAKLRAHQSSPIGGLFN